MLTPPPLLLPVVAASCCRDVAVRILKWGADWLLKAHIKSGDAPEDNAFVGQVRYCSCCHYCIY
jgi:hypothetical protein